MSAVLETLITNSSVTTHFQPVVSIKKRSIVGVEALSRGVDATRLLPPQPLFDSAGQAKLLEQLDSLCKRSALAEFAQLPGKPAGLMLFMNLAAARLNLGQLSLTQVRRAVEEAGLKPSDVVLEFSDRDGDAPGLRSFTESCKSAGFTVAYDDLDGSPEGLRRLSHLRPDLVKVDGVLVRGISGDAVRQEQFRALAALSRRAGALTVAEGVENEEDAALCLELGADLLQGFYYGRPVPPLNYPFSAIQSAVERSASRYKANLAGRNQVRLREGAKHRQLLEKMLADLSKLEPAGFGQCLAGFVNAFASLECLYMLDKAGQQVTRTVVWQHQKDHSRSLLFAPALEGADHSLKDYYLGLSVSGEDSFVSEPYVSLATGSLCRTLAAHLTALDGKPYVLCMDIKTQ
jgi:EAL domain-containing protein (putative c-di-GMP-specific phosphodiesterase class I)